MRLKSRLFVGIIFISVMAILVGSCSQKTTPVSTIPVTKTIPELKYILFSNFNSVFYVDADLYPIVREGQEEKNALEQFPTIRADSAEFLAILTHLNLSNKNEYSDAEKLLIYREHKKLTLGVEMTVKGDGYNFTLRNGEGQGERIEGTISKSGFIKILKREPSYNTYPICLAKGTQIDTPNGPVSVEQSNVGMVVWTQDGSGNRVPAVVVKISKSPVPETFLIKVLTLQDGRTISASPGHPSATKRPLGDFQVGDVLDGSMVVKAELWTYYGGETYDLLPSGSSGVYWANGILLLTTLVTN